MTSHGEVSIELKTSSFRFVHRKHGQVQICTCMVHVFSFCYHSFGFVLISFFLSFLSNFLSFFLARETRTLFTKSAIDREVKQSINDQHASHYKLSYQ